MARRLRVPISTARAKLFQLTDLVRNADEDTVVLLEQRGTVGGVALVREARLAYLEARVAALDKPGSRSRSRWPAAWSRRWTTTRSSKT